jgi:hypothetical protein
VTILFIQWTFDKNPLEISLNIRLVPRDVFTEDREKVSSQPEKNGNSGLWFGGFVIAIWVLIVIGVVYVVLIKNRL